MSCIHRSSLTRCLQQFTSTSIWNIPSLPGARGSPLRGISTSPETKKQAAQQSLKAFGNTSTIRRGNRSKAKDLQAQQTSSTERFPPSKPSSRNSSRSGHVQSWISASNNATLPNPNKDRDLALYGYSQRTSYSQFLANKARPTILYTAPSHVVFSVATQLQALFCYMYAGYNFNVMCLNPPAGIAAWIPPAFGGICALMAGYGTFLALGPRRLIRRMTAVPHQLLTEDMMQRKQGEGRAGSADDLRIEIELKRLLPLPFLRPRLFSVKPQDIMLPYKVGRPDLGRQLKAGDVRAKQFMKDLEEKTRREKTVPMWKKPFTRLSQATFEFVQNVSRVWTQSGLVKLEVKGIWLGVKMDATGGEMIDGGHALDRLFKVKNTQ